jgi:DNA-binding sugar fermentation-stimulating protein
MLTELLIPNAKILVKSTDIKKRKTRFELIAVDKNGLRVVVNSGLHNKLAEEILPNRSRKPMILIMG